MFSTKLDSFDQHVSNSPHWKHTPERIKDAAVEVNDILASAKAIAETQCEKPTLDQLLKIVELINQRETLEIKRKELENAEGDYE